MKKNNKFLLSYKNLRVIVTGTTGFKGAWLAFWLHSIGAKVTGISLRPESDSILFKSLNLNRKIDQFYLDIANYNKLNEIVKKVKPDIIFHLAAQSIVSKSFNDPVQTIKTNVLGSTNILETFKANKISSLVYITSDKCYLNLDIKKNYTENDILGGLDNYSSSKACAELIFSSYHSSFFKDKKKLTAVSARAGNVIGGGDMKVNRIIPDLVKFLDKNKNIVLRNPKATRPWQHVLEPLSGYLLLGNNLLNKNLNSNIVPSWNFGPKKINCKSVEFITNKVLNIWGIKNPKVKFNNKLKFHESKFLSLNIEKAKKELKWEPRLSLDQTLKLTVEWYKNFLSKNSSENITKKQIEFFLSK